MKSPKLKIIDWYIIKKFIGTYFLTLLLVIIIIVVFDIISGSFSPRPFERIIVYF